MSDHVYPAVHSSGVHWLPEVGKTVKLGHRNPNPNRRGKGKVRVSKDDKVKPDFVVTLSGKNPDDVVSPDVYDRFQKTR
ncbi:MAG: hypothetical protein GY804_07360 [Alphaproteobacteria bacterium]|nr:hypothetical protein [Alphaproteobacteria bacterium]